MKLIQIVTARGALQRLIVQDLRLSAADIIDLEPFVRFLV